MNSLRFAVMTSVSALATVCFASANAAIASYEESVAVTVKYQELDLSSNQGASALYARLRTASKVVCASLDGRELKQHAAYQSCFNQALSAAVIHVNKQTVTALHERSLRGERAS